MSKETYVDGFLLPVAEDKLELYRQTAEKAGAIWREHGALEYVETVLDDGEAKDMRSFVEAAGAKPGEAVVLAWAVFESKEARDAANARIMADPRLEGMCREVEKIFDCKRMAFGGFRSLVRL